MLLFANRHIGCFDDYMDASTKPKPSESGGVSVRPSREFAFLAAFGIPVEKVTELHMYQGNGSGIDELPDAVALLLRRLHAQGNAIGPAIMALVHNGRRLRVGEAIYLAVIENAGPTHVRAFIAPDDGVV